MAGSPTPSVAWFKDGVHLAGTQVTSKYCNPILWNKLRNKETELKCQNLNFVQIKKWWKRVTFTKDRASIA